MKYKVIKEYKRFYLCKSEKGYLECFTKNNYKVDIDGYIYKFREYIEDKTNKDSMSRKEVFYD